MFISTLGDAYTAPGKFRENWKKNLNHCRVYVSKIGLRLCIVNIFPLWCEMNCSFQREIKNKSFRLIFLLFFGYFCIFCLCRPWEANLQLPCQPCWLPNKEWHVPAGWRDAGFEPGTAGFTVWCTTIEPPHPPNWATTSPIKKIIQFQNCSGEKEKKSGSGWFW